MNAPERLKQIKDRRNSVSWTVPLFSDIDWLIQRVEKLTVALEKIEDRTSLFDSTLNRICKKTMEEE